MCSAKEKSANGSAAKERRDCLLFPYKTRFSHIRYEGYVWTKPVVGGFQE